ncbi:MAG: hypothetical protein K6D56_01465 [Clostridia bacterium]|jgi:V/A-type H+-transporting ATPase subunit E|nr:hypothetical protein [Clostridia bacterium]
MSIDKITSTILAEAEAEKETILAEAKEQCDKIISEARAKADKITSDMVKKGNEEKEKIVERRRSVAAIDAKKITLKKKQDILDECFTGAIDRIVNLPREEYVDYLVRVGVNSEMYGGLLTFNQKEHDSVAEEVIQKLNAATDERRKEKYGDFPYSERFELNPDSEPMTGGFWIRYRLTYADNTVGTQIDMIRPKIAGEVSRELFGEE